MVNVKVASTKMRLIVLVIIGIFLMVDISEGLNLKSKNNEHVSSSRIVEALKSGNAAEGVSKISFAENQATLESRLAQQIHEAVTAEVLEKFLDMDSVKARMKTLVLTLAKSLLRKVVNPVAQNCKDNELAVMGKKAVVDDFDLSLLETESDMRSREKHDAIMKEKLRQYMNDNGFFDTLKEIGSSVLSNAGDLINPLMDKITQYLVGVVDKYGGAISAKAEQVVEKVCEQAKQMAHES